MDDENLLEKLLMYGVVVREKLAWKEGYEQGFEQGFEQGIGQVINQVAKATRMLKEGNSFDEISIVTGLDLDKIKCISEIL